MNTFFYIIAISLQVAGALLLLFFSISAKRKNVIKAFAGNGIIIRDNNSMELEYNEEAFRETYRVTLLNKYAFFYIASGYFLGVFGIIEWDSKWIVGIFIIICTIILMTAAYVIVNLIVKYSIKVNKRITNDELSYVGVKPDIGNISNKMIDELF